MCAFAVAGMMRLKHHSPTPDCGAVHFYWECWCWCLWLLSLAGLRYLVLAIILHSCLFVRSVAAAAAAAAAADCDCDCGGIWPAAKCLAAAAAGVYLLWRDGAADGSCRVWLAAAQVADLHRFPVIKWNGSERILT